MAWLILLRGSKKPSFNCKSHATDSQCFSRGRMCGVILSHSIRGGMATSSTELESTIMAGFSIMPFPCLLLFSLAQLRLQLFLRISFYLIVSCYKLQQDNMLLLMARHPEHFCVCFSAKGGGGHSLLQQQQEHSLGNREEKTQNMISHLTVLNDKLLTGKAAHWGNQQESDCFSFPRDC